MHPLLGLGPFGTHFGPSPGTLGLPETGVRAGPSGPQFFFVRRGLQEETVLAWALGAPGIPVLPPPLSPLCAPPPPRPVPQALAAPRGVPAARPGWHFLRCRVPSRRELLPSRRDSEPRLGLGWDLRAFSVHQGWAVGVAQRETFPQPKTTREEPVLFLGRARVFSPLLRESWKE